MDYLDDLNGAQKSAVLHKEGPLLIIAGAGAGKTRTICYRIHHLIHHHNIPANNILAITFTNKAAKEMRDRVIHLVESYKVRKFIKPDGGEETKNFMNFMNFMNFTNFQTLNSEMPFIGTFHALGVHLLRDYGASIGISRYFSIADESETLSLIKDAIEKAGFARNDVSPYGIRSAISKEKGVLNSHDTFSKSLKEQEHSGSGYFLSIVDRVWHEYEKLLKKQKTLDFDDLISKTVELLRADARALDMCHRRWKYVHIDEYQDTNAAQFELARLLALRDENICVVGDIDQSIYSWRGADFRNVLNFEKIYPRATTIVLEENYRSTPIILDAANEIIKKNVMRKEKRLFTTRKGGEPIALYRASTEKDEAQFVAESIVELIDTGVPRDDIAVLYRANFQSRALEETLLMYRIPYQVLGVKFYERKEVKDLLGYIRCALNPENIESFKRIANVPQRGIGKISLDRILEGHIHELSPRIREKMAEINLLLGEIRGLALTMPPSVLLKTILAKTNNLGLSADSKEDEERMQNLAELVTVATTYDLLPFPEGTEKLLSDASLASEQDSLTDDKKEEKRVRLMTVHASKGLEFEHVFITGLEQGLFPHERAGDENRDEEEERRLFYVALTRAKSKATLSFADTRLLFGRTQFNIPSEFIGDIPKHLVRHVGVGPSNNDDDLPVIEWETLKKRGKFIKS